MKRHEQTEAPDLLPGDCLLYNTPGDFVDWCIRMKTWSVAAHCECYIGEGRSVASRNGIGVDRYPARFAGLIAVLRPVAPFRLDTALSYFFRVQKQKYDFAGLMCFFLAAKRGSKDRQFCSEFLTNFYRAGGLHPVHRSWSSDKVARRDRSC